MTTSRSTPLTTKLLNLKQQCPMPVLLRKLGLGAYAKPSCRSPLRADQSASWGIFQHASHWFFKDHGNGDSGDEVTLIARLNNWDVQRDFQRIVKSYEATAAKEDVSSVSPASATIHQSSTPPILSHFTTGTADQLKRLSLLRSFSMEGLQLAAANGFLMFGHKFNFEVYGVKDQSGLLGEVRRLDGQLFAGSGSTPAHKSHTLKGSTKSWPLGIIEAGSTTKIALVEGLPDFLACFDFLHREGKPGVVSPVAMLAASVSIDEQALSLFADKQVRLFPHYDQAGVEAAKRWAAQLNKVAASIDCFLFSQFADTKDLADLNCLLKATPATLNHLKVLL